MAILIKCFFLWPLSRTLRTLEKLDEFHREMGNMVSDHKVKDANSPRVVQLRYLKTERRV